MRVAKKFMVIFRNIFASSVANIKAVRIRYWWVILLSALIHRLPFAIFPRESMVDLKRICMILSYLLLLWVFSRNFNFRSFRIMAAGTLLNFIAIVANGGLMPVSPEARQLAEMAFLGPAQYGMVLPEGSGVLLPVSQTNLWFLTDIIPASHHGGVYSPGDIVIAIALIYFILEILFKKNHITQPVQSIAPLKNMENDKNQTNKITDVPIGDREFDLS